MPLLDEAGLQFKLTLLTALGISITLLVFAVLTSRAIDARSAQIQRERLALAELVADRFDADLAHAAHLQTMAVADPDFDVQDDTLDPERAALEYIYHSSWLSTRQLVLLDANARVLASYPESATLAEREFGDLSFVREVLHQSVGTRRTHEPATIGEGIRGFTISDGLPGSVFGEPAVAIGVPLRGRGGEVTGTVVQVLDLLDTGMKAPLHHARLGEAGNVAVISANGTTVTTLRTDDPLLGRSHRTTIASLVTRGRPEVGAYHIRDEALLLAYAPLSVAPWGVVITQPLSDALSTVTQLRREFLVLTVATLVFALLIMEIVTRRIVRPVQQLIKAAKRIASGDLDHPVTVRGEDEVRELGQTFEEMRVSLVASHEDMQQRTRELSVLLDTAVAGAEAKTVDELVERVTEILTAELYPENLGFMFLDERGEYLVVHPSYHGIPEEMYGFRVPYGSGVTGTVASTGEPRLIGDVGTVPEYVEGLSGVRSELCVPVAAGNEIIGVINIESTELDAFSDKDLRLVSAVASHVSIVFDKLRFIEEARRRTNELEALRRTTLDLMSQLELASLLRGIVQRATELLHANGGALHLYRPHRNEIEIAVSYNLGYDYTGMSVAVGQGLAGQVVATGEPLIVDRYQQWDDKAMLYEDAPFATAIGVPLYWQDQVVGVLSLVNMDEDRIFDSNDLHLLDAFAQQASVAIENARLYKAAEQRASELETLHRVSLTLSASLALEDVLDAILAGTFQLLSDPDDAHIFLYQEDELRFGAARWADDRQERPWSDPRPDGLTYTVARRGQPIVVPDMRVHPLFQDVPSEWEGAIIGVPLKIGARVVGVMNVAFQKPRTFSEAELRLLNLLGTRAAIAIENARLFAAEQASRRRAETLQGVAAVIGSTLEVEELLDQVLEELQKVVQYDSASVQLLRDDYLEIIAGRGFDDPDNVVGTRFPIRPGTPDEEIIRHKRPVLLSDTHEEYPKFMHDEYSHIRCWLGAPLLHKGEAIGMITLDRTEVDAFDEEDVELAVTFANHVAIALENARLYERAQRQAVTDGLTRLYNSRYFYQRLAEELERSRRYDHPCSVIMLDLDDFKRYNDLYGHLAGDDLLRELAGLMQEHVREVDTLARYGGEEFVVILPETESTQARRLAERLRRTVRAHEFVVRDAKQVGRITISGGVATYPDHATEIEALVQAADMALLEAKETKDRVCVALNHPTS